jgi:hypothetical protein
MILQIWFRKVYFVGLTEIVVIEVKKALEVRKEKEVIEVIEVRAVREVQEGAMGLQEKMVR